MLDRIFRALYRSYVEIRQSSTLSKAEFALKRDGFEALLGAFTLWPAKSQAIIFN